MAYRMGWSGKITNVIEHLVAALLASSFIFIAWIAFVAEPLVIKQYTFAQSTFTHKEEVATIAKGEKPRWSVKFCQAIKDTTFIRDRLNLIAEKQNPVNFNDGTIKRVANTVRIPTKFETGPIEIWKVVIYDCFKFFQITVRSGREVGTLIE